MPHVFFQESLDYFLKTWSKLKICLKLFEIWLNGKDASWPDWGWFAEVGEGIGLILPLLPLPKQMVMARAYVTDMAGYGRTEF